MTSFIATDLIRALRVAVTAALAALVGGGYISARRIARKSLLHPATAGMALALTYVSAFTSGDTSPIDVASIAAGGVLPTAGAALGWTELRVAPAAKGNEKIFYNCRRQDFGQPGDSERKY